ncbi:MAG: hypothetical protein LCI00_00530 [Chloroflexi bacterium]|nr:hypothetical protein [Chloroflexota bacterium]MCC6896915.1 hypothetical protein [Anaerolineae bacterium]
MSSPALPVEGTWLGQKALTLETDGLKFVTIPGMGAKIVSLFDKTARREWLLPPINRPFKPVAYGAAFADQDMSGWDEMFPTINACTYPVKGAYAGRSLPDHGEVWALPWQTERVTQTCIRLSTIGQALPYRLTRQTELVSANQFRLTYEVINTGTGPLAALWTAHPQFMVDAETRIRLPASVDSLVNVHQTADWGAVGNRYSWPLAQSQQGQFHRLDQIGEPALHNCRKFYLPADHPVSWAALQQGHDGAWIRLSWNVSELPYLGIWVDEGAYNTASTAALEPSTGFYDALDFAWRNNRAMTLQPAEPVRWTLTIELGVGTIIDTDRA